MNNCTTVVVLAINKVIIHTDQLILNVLIFCTGILTLIRAQHSPQETKTALRAKHEL